MRGAPAVGERARPRSKPTCRQESLTAGKPLESARKLAFPSRQEVYNSDLPKTCARAKRPYGACSGASGSCSCSVMYRVGAAPNALRNIAVNALGLL